MPQQVEASPIAVSIPRAAAMVDVCSKTIYRAIRRGELPSVRLGGRRLIRPADLTAWIDVHVEEA